jgi:hypothetical protein
MTIVYNGSSVPANIGLQPADDTMSAAAEAGR